MDEMSYDNRQTMAAILQKLEQESEREPEAVPEQEHLEETTLEEETLEQKVQKNLNSFETVRREFGSDLQEPVISFADNKFKVNATCLKAFPDYNYANILVHRPTKILALIPCAESRRDAYPLCYVTDGKRHPRETTCKLLFAMMYDFMGWNPAYRYKILGKKVKANGRELLAFDLTRVRVIPRADDSGERNGSSKEGYFLEDWRDHFGIPFAEHQQSYLINTFGGFAVYSVKDNTCRKASPEEVDSLSEQAADVVPDG